MNETQQVPPQRVIRLEVSNFKKISAVEVWPDGDVVVIAGANGAGKSSVLDGLFSAICGKGVLCEKPIKDGASKGHIVVELNDFIVTRKFTQAGGTTLEVTSKDGIKFKSPQELLDGLTGSLSFDPLAFSRMCEKEPKKAVEVLRELCGVDFTEVDKNRLVAYEARTTANRDLAQLKGKVAAYVHHPDAPETEVSNADIAKEIQLANEQNKKNHRDRTENLATIRNSFADCERQFNNATDEAVEAEAAWREAEKALERAKVKFATCANVKAELTKKLDVLNRMVGDEELLAALIVDIDTAPILERMTKSDEINTKVRSNKRRKELKDEEMALAKKVDALTTTIETCDAEKLKLLEQAKSKLPIPEISFTDGCVLLNGQPFTQGSTAEQIRASVAMGMALNPTLRVIIIKDGALLDPISRKIIEVMAATNNYQVFIECITDGAPTIVIEDGKEKE